MAIIAPADVTVERGTYWKDSTKQQPKTIPHWKSLIFATCAQR